jgi:hypothetical protein
VAEPERPGAWADDFYRGEMRRGLEDRTRPLVG